MSQIQASHRQTFIDILAENIRQKSNDENLAFSSAEVRVLLEWLGYDLDDLTFVDTKDRGIDAWFVTDSAVEIFQVKTHELTPDQLLDLSPFNGEGVADLARAQAFLMKEEPSNVQKKELKLLLYQWASLLRSSKLQSRNVETPVTLHLVILGNRLTQQAQLEFDAFQRMNQDVTLLDEVPVRFYAALHVCNDVIDRRWREDNREWIDRLGKRNDAIQLSPFDKQHLSDNANAIFYCRAIDLVDAYENFGYQLFEPNVRANITNSRVNQEIRSSVMHQRTRHEFRFLNNGVTVTCESFKTPKYPQSPHFTIRQPGIVNGLQTVVALHTAYKLLPPEEKADFEEHCSVLIRLLNSNAVDDITKVVKSTNNQNPMKLRNLKSNSSEQLILIRIFAEELSWFFEAKEGAWEAFEKDPQKWRPRINKRPKDFRINNSRKVRRIDNEELAQTWLAFIGFASEAVNEKKEIFQDRFYEFIFKMQSSKHGHDYGFSINQAKEAAINEAPNPYLMLVAFLCRKFAVELVPSAAENRLDACSRLGLDPKLPKTELDSKLAQDNSYMLNQALAGMSILFTEFVGFVLFRALGENAHRFGKRVLSNHSFRILATESIDRVKGPISEGYFEPSDLIVVLWHVFVEQIEDMLSSSWGQAYRAASVKIRFTFSKETREKICKDTESLDQYMKKRPIRKPWAVGVPDGMGLFEFVRNCIMD